MARSSRSIPAPRSSRRTHTEALVSSFLNPMQMETLEKADGARFQPRRAEGLARFRASVVKQRKGYDAVFRIINSTKVRTMDQLGLPEYLKVLTQYQNGLVLITGAVGSGKSTTLAAMVQEVNAEPTRPHHHAGRSRSNTSSLPRAARSRSAKCTPTPNRSAPPCAPACAKIPTSSWSVKCATWKRSALAITASETGHLVLATLHTSNAARTLDRILDAFPVEQQGQIRTMVSESLRGIISQQLVPKLDGTGRVIAMEVMVNTPAVANLIREAKTFMLPGIIQTGKKLGMKMMDDALMDLVEAGTISPYEAHDRAEQKSLFKPMLK